MLFWLLVGGAALVMAHGAQEHAGHVARGLKRVTRGADHPLHALYKRQSTNYPPQDQIGPTPRAAWLQTYQSVKAAGFIPGFPNSTNVGSWPQYAAGINPADPAICSFALAKCTVANDIVNAPDGKLGIAFDDGPQDPTPQMLAFLQTNNIPSTHFVIGSRIAENPQIFQQILQIDGHIGCHTWSHPLMSTLTDEQILGELGWANQIIYDQTGGFLPSFWRPPYGDVDNRVRAIAQHVFGMVTTLWNQDPDDWCLADDGTDACPNQGPHTDANLERELDAWFSGAQSPGLIVLEHEHHNRSITAFKNAYSTIKSSGWQVHNIPDLFNSAWYANAADNSSTPIPMSVGMGQVSVTLSSSAPTSSAVKAATSSAKLSTTSTPTNTARADSVSAGWNRLSTTMHNVIIGASIGVGVLLLALIVFFGLRRRRQNKSKAFQRKKFNPDRNSVLLNLAEKRTSLFSEKPLHPYDQVDTFVNASNDRLVPAQVPLYSASDDFPRDRKLRGASGIRTVPPYASPPLANSLAVPQNDSRPISGTTSIYSQDDRRATFAPPVPTVPSSSLAAPKTRKSGFHRPNRDQASPYDIAPANQRGNWI